MKPLLISFKLCPFVQRNVITLKQQGLEHDIRYIDLSNPPDWFLQLSPLGKVPILQIEDSTVLFESAVINEYLNDSSSQNLLPKDPLLRAQNRAWIAFSEPCLMDMHQWMTSQNEQQMNTLQQQARDKLLRLEQALNTEPFFNGAEFSLVDSSYAPLFMRYQVLNQLNLAEPMLDSTMPRLQNWSQTLLALPEVSTSVVVNFSELLRDFLQQSNSVLLWR